MAHLDDTRARDYVGLKLEPDELAAASAHLEGCPDCQLKVTKARAETDNTQATLDPGDITKDPAELPKGMHAGRYLILEMLGQGGMGIVYSAYDPDLDRKVALKLLLPSSDGDAQEYRARLLREAQAMARLSHPNVVAVHDAGLLDDRLFVAMEMVEGQTLSKWLREKQRPWQQIRDVFIDAGRGLHAAHSAGLVHRDFKPSNVLVSANGRVCVTDFGLARSAEALKMTGPVPVSVHVSMTEDATKEVLGPPPVPAAEPASQPASQPSHASPSHGSQPSQPSQGSQGSHSSHLSDSLTRPGVVMGTPAYMAPEQIAGLVVDARSDQYSFCVSLYEALYGARPRMTPEVARGEAQLLLPPPKRDGGPQWLRRAVAKGLSSRPEDRHPSVDALISAMAVSPYRKAQRAVLAAAGALFVAGGIFAGLWLQDAPKRRCDPTAAREAAWSAEHRTQVRASILGTGKSWAQAASEGVEKALDGYAKAWSGAQADACLAFELSGKTTALSSPRLECLAERREELSATVGVLLGSNADNLEKTTAAVQALTPIESCARLELASARPTDVKMASQKAALRPKLAKAKALFESGQYQPALGASRDALDMARDIGDVGLTADALYYLGQSLDKTGDVKGAAETLLDAAIQADASHRDDTAARAYIFRLYVVGYEMQKPDESAREERHARAAIARLGGSAELEGQLENSMGAMFKAANDNVQARAHLIKAMAQLEAAFGSDSPRIAGPMNNLAMSLIGLGKLDEAESLLNRVIAIRTASFGADHPSMGPVVMNLGELACKRGKYDEALKLYEESQGRIERGQGPMHPFVMITMNARGATLTHLGRFSEALEIHTAALAKRIKVHGEKHPWVAFDLTGIGRARLGLGDAQGALEPLEQALALREAAKGQDLRDIAETRFALAKTLLALGKDPERAKKLAEAAAEAFEKNGRRVGPPEEARQWLSAR